jgi:hypothetical protein
MKIEEKIQKYVRPKCQHGRAKTYCFECGGGSLCEHRNRKSLCKYCKGGSICEHDKEKTRCVECRGGSICVHKKRKSCCVECRGGSICIHEKQKRNCRICNESYFCEHGKQKPSCKPCGGSSLCKSSWCHTRKIKKYNDYCLPCCIQSCPDIKVSRNYKTKETDISNRIDLAFPNFTWVNDKRIQDGCSLRRPDKLLDMGTHIIIVEVDENKHTDYDTSCENKRLMEISRDLGHRPIVFIRFNPDNYIDQCGNAIKSCWKINKLGVMCVMKNKQKEWEERVEILNNKIQYWIDNLSEKTIEIVELFY